MKGIRLCGECGFYDIYRHKCREGARVVTDPKAAFYEDCPLEDVPEVKHGKWIDKENPQWRAYEIRYCSNCDWSIHKTHLRRKDSAWNYCPNCGAKMDLKED